MTTSSASDTPAPPSSQVIGNCLDADSQSLLGSLPAMPAGHTGHAALLDVFFDLLARYRPAAFCDIGANKGEAGRRARAVLPEAKVFGFEANPDIHGRYAEINTAAGVSWVNAAAADREGSIELHIPRVLSRALKGETLVSKRVKVTQDTGKSSLLKRDEAAVYSTVTVPAVTIDGYLGTHAPEGRVALWVDVEGAALTVLKGAEEVLKRTDLIIVEVEGFSFWQDQALALAVLNHLQSMGFVPVLRDREYTDAQFNVICLRDRPDLDTVRHRIGQAIDAGRSQATPAERPSDITPATVPVLIPCFNNPTYCESMLVQLQKLGFASITFVDNASDSPAMLDWLDRATGSGAVVERLPQNLGPHDSIYTPERLASLPRYFCVTDPDLRFNAALPDDFLAIMADAMARHGRSKAGFALDISDRARLRQEEFTIGRGTYRIWEWERRYWADRVDFAPSGDPIFRASVDTTFALHDRTRFKRSRMLHALRFGGRFTAQHLPWLSEPSLDQVEAALYRSTQQHSFYMG